MKKFWLIYDLLLMVFTALVVFVYITGFLIMGISVIYENILIPTVNNTYVIACSFRLVSKYNSGKTN